MATLDPPVKVAWHLPEELPWLPGPLVDNYLRTRFDKDKPLDDPSHADALIEFVNLQLNLKGIRVLYSLSHEVVDQCKQWEPLVRAAENGSLSAWNQFPEGALALIFLLTVIPRKLDYLNLPRLIQLEAQALGFAVDAIASGVFRACPIQWKMFFYFPYILHETLIAHPPNPIEALAARPKTRSRHRVSVREVLDSIIKHANVFSRFRRHIKLE